MLFVFMLSRHASHRPHCQLPVLAHLLRQHARLPTLRLPECRSLPSHLLAARLARVRVENVELLELHLLVVAEAVQPLEHDVRLGAKATAYWALEELHAIYTERYAFRQQDYDNFDKRAR